MSGCVGYNILLLCKLEIHMKDLIFSPADILLPNYSADSAEWTKWSVIACDQFTSEKEYWDKVRENINYAPSAFDLILPEAFLKTPNEEKHKVRIAESMGYLDGFLKKYENSLVYVERTLPGIGIRRGIVGKIDLEKYEYAAGSASAVRPTEATVLDRIPPRMKIRGESAYELPHVMVFTDGASEIISKLTASKESMEKLYDFELMLNGGHIAGYLISGELLEKVVSAISAYESSFDGENPVIYAVGDGNHSLAAAKAHYEAKKGEIGYEASRYALCEIVDISESSIEFEPIYRIVKGCDTADMISELEKLSGEGTQKVCAIVGGVEKEFAFADATHALTVGTLQNFLDEYVKSHPEAECDYIHGVESLRALSTEEGVVGFLFDGMEKEELFPYVQTNGVLPRKTFSMGDSYSKRYYTEVRRIKE